MDGRFTTAMALLERSAGARERYSGPFLRAFPVTGASISTLGDVLGNEIVSATSREAQRLDELQLDLGEGPCWDALRLGKPVSEPDLASDGARRWPSFAPAAGSVAAASIFAFPVAVGSLRLGAVDLFATTRLELTPAQSRQATAMAKVVGRHLLQYAVEHSGAPEESAGGYSRRVVHQATGVVLAQLDMTAEEAALVLQGHAFATGRPVPEVAADVVAGRLGFRTVDGEIEVLQ